MCLVQSLHVLNHVDVVVLDVEPHVFALLLRVLVLEECVFVDQLLFVGLVQLLLEINFDVQKQAIDILVLLWSQLDSLFPLTFDQVFDVEAC